MIIDFHAHTFPSKIAEGVLQKLQHLSRSKPYTDGTTDELMLVPPVNWCPIEQDFVENAVAFAMPAVRPYRIGLNTGIVSRHLFRDSHYQEAATAGDLPDMKLAMCALPGGAATMLDMPLNAKKKLRSLTLRALSNEVVVGLMGITLQK